MTLSVLQNQFCTCLECLLVLQLPLAIIWSASVLLSQQGLRSHPFFAQPVKIFGGVFCSSVASRQMAALMTSCDDSQQSLHNFRGTPQQKTLFESLRVCWELVIVIPRQRSHLLVAQTCHCSLLYPRLCP